jgi:hypothetical protein
VLPSAPQATSPIASLTPANVAATEPSTQDQQLISGMHGRHCLARIRPLSKANRAASADAALRVSLKTHKDTPCSRKS